MAHSFRRAREERRPFDIEARIIRADGESRLVRALGRPETDDHGNLQGVFGVIRDITDERRMNDQLAHVDKMASLGSLAASIAHEVNNPLTYIHANAELLAMVAAGPHGEALSPHELESVITDVADGAQRIRKIIDDLRTFSHQRTGERSRVHLREVLEAALRLCSFHLRREALLDVAIDDGIPPVGADPNRLVQVATNLLVNASHAVAGAPHEDHRIELIAGPLALGEGAYFEVRDTGVGMSPSVLEAAFQPFFTTKPEGAGTGLGLSISRDIVEAAGGTIDVESTEGEGTTVRVSLPAAPTRTQTSVIPPSQRPFDLEADEPIRIFLVDDEVNVLRAYGRLLKQHDVATEHDPRAALRRLAAGDFDLVICDLTMPHLGGAELYRRLNAVRPDLTARFAFMTGNATVDGDVEALVQAGVPLFKKPLLGSDLEVLIARVAHPGFDGFIA